MNKQVESSGMIFNFLAGNNPSSSVFSPFFSLVLLGFICSLFISCNEAKQDLQTDEPIVLFLKEAKNLKNIHYIDSFHTHYNRAIAQKKLDKSASLLEAFGINLDANFQPDSLFVTTCEAFLIEHENALTNYQKIALNYYMGSQYDFMGDLEKSDVYLKKTKLHAQEIEEIKLRAFAGEIIASHLKRKGNFEEAIKQTNQNIADFQKIKDTNNLAMSYGGLSSIYKNLKAYDESEKYIKKSLELAISVKDTVRIWAAYVDLARPNSLAIKPKEILYYSKKAKQINDVWKNSTDHQKSYTYATYARALLSNKKLDSVAYYIAKAEEFVTKQSRLKFDLLGMKAELDLLNANPLNNVEIFEKEYEIAKQNNDFLIVEMIATILADHAKSQKEYQKAYEYTKEKYDLRDEAWMNDTKNQVAYLDKKFQTAQKEQLIAQQNLKITKNYYLISAIIAAIIILILSWAFISIRQKRRLAIEEAKRQEQFTFQLLQNTEDERKRIANELHDSVNQDLLTMKHQLVSGESVEPHDFTKVIEEVRNISRNLHPTILENLGLKTSIENLCEKLTSINLFTTCEIDYSNQLSKNKELQIYRIVQEALNNTLKHANANAAKVTLSTSSNLLQLNIKDNGTGFDVNQELKNPKSFGLQSILQRTKAIAGTISFSSNDKGSNIKIEIPL